ncbi:MAG: O-methyltransferase [Acholeplasmatales bacterium]|nr:O-methyltransferase [Acholeplasmatales bacterium]
MIKKTNNLEFDDKTKAMREYAVQNGVPIIKDEGLAFLKNIIAVKNPKTILEVGTAIGYSALEMAKVRGAHVYTIERDPKMYEEATKNVNESAYKDNVTIIFKDALEAFDDVKNIKFDMIFIDAAKAQYTKFFELYTPLLNENGIVVCDNMLFHGLVSDNVDTTGMTRGLRGLVVKLGRFHDFLFSNDKFDSTLYDIGDGMSVSILK